MKLDGFYKDKKVLVTGHTGFKGTWLSLVLLNMGANVAGYALEAPTNPALFTLCGIEKEIKSVKGDIRDLESLKKAVKEFNPDIVIHMAAQPIVRESYKNPVYTYETNVMGTVNILEAVRECDSVKSFLNVTTDKVYLNREWDWGYRENEELNGFDPYSNSKSCSELVTDCYRNSFFGKDNKTRKFAISTCRAGNVIGGGDFASDRIIPDCVRAVEKGASIIVRNPHSTRPYQHVMEPVMAYLMVAKAGFEDISIAGAYNVGPDDSDCVTTGKLVDLFCDKWNATIPENPSLKKATWENRSDGGPHEAKFLKLDSTKLKRTFGWQPTWNIEKAIEKTVVWTTGYLGGADIKSILNEQVCDFVKESSIQW